MLAPDSKLRFSAPPESNGLDFQVRPCIDDSPLGYLPHLALASDLSTPQLVSLCSSCIRSSAVSEENQFSCRLLYSSDQRFEVDDSKRSFAVKTCACSIQRPFAICHALASPSIRARFFEKMVAMKSMTTRIRRASLSSL